MRKKSATQLKERGRAAEGGENRNEKKSDGRKRKEKYTSRTYGADGGGTSCGRGKVHLDNLGGRRVNPRRRREKKKRRTALGNVTLSQNAE